MQVWETALGALQVGQPLLTCIMVGRHHDLNLRQVHAREDHYALLSKRGLLLQKPACLSLLQQLTYPGHRAITTPLPCSTMAGCRTSGRCSAGLGGIRDP